MNSLEINENLAMDVEQLLRGGYQPLTTFLDQDNLDSVLSKMRLKNGKIWPIPILFPIPDNKIRKGDKIRLRFKNHDLSSITVSSIFEYDMKKLIRGFFGSYSNLHPGVTQLKKWPSRFITGQLRRTGDLSKIMKISSRTPLEVRKIIKKRKWKRIVGFHTRNPPHRAHEFLHKTSLELTDGILIHPVIGSKKSGDFTMNAILDGYRTYVKNYLPTKKAILTPLLTYSRYAGPKEAVFTALVRKNYGCTHFIVGRDHTGVKNFYGKYESQKIFSNFPDLGMEIFSFDEPFFCAKCKQITTSKTCPHSITHHIEISGSKIRNSLLNKRTKISENILRMEVLNSLRKVNKIFVE